MFGCRVQVSDDRFMAFVDAEGIAADAAAIERDEAGKDAGVEVVEQQVGGAAIVPSSSSGRSCFAEKWRISRISICCGLVIGAR